MKKDLLESLHNMAMDNAELALVSLHRGDLKKFSELSAQAFLYEKKAALQLYEQQIEPSRSVLFRSAAYLALDNADFNEAHKLYEFALEGTPPAEISEELEDLKIEVDRVKTENDKYIEFAITLLKTESRPILNDKLQKAKERALLAFQQRDINWDYVNKYLNRQFSIESDKHTTIDENYVPWINFKKGITPRPYWNRYTQFLEKDEELAIDTIDKLDNITDDILDHLKDPKERGDWDKRGMVVGQVQSGKTANYVGLMCKAADYGYRIIIVLAGLSNDLRSQTQFRVDEGFLGIDTKIDRSSQEASRDFGVARYDNSKQAHPVTSSALDGDFSTASRYLTGTNIKGTDPVVMVVKKHGTVLKQLVKWLADSGETLSDGKKIINNIPLLIIDDEADNASININKEGVSTINGLIRSLLSLFQQSGYVGYTATPFANIFIPLPANEERLSRGLNIRLDDFWKFSGEDLFPRDFIINIPPPSNYVGPKEVFGIDASLIQYPGESEKGLPIVKELYPAEYLRFIPDKHKMNDPLPEELPPSLKEAVKCFILSCAIRRVRGQIKNHNSMLIHVTLYVKWQDKIATLVDRLLKHYQQQIEFKQGNIIQELKTLWEQNYIKVTEIIINDTRFDDPFITQHDWFEIETQLHKAASKIQVRAIHGTKKLEGLSHKNITPLDYYDYRDVGLSVIAVGGNKLSRGLTLNGLSISYYLRASKMYDTLMQMGRWFGYRGGYLDLCRIYTSEELIEWYKYITVASEELREDFEEMKIQGQTPRNFGLKVRQHPDVLKITAINKMRHGHYMQVSFADKLRETWRFSRRSRTTFTHNFIHTVDFINSLNAPSAKNGQQYVWSEPGNYADAIRFLRGYKNEDNLEQLKLTEYIEKQIHSKFLINWTIVLISNEKDKREDLFKVQEKAIAVGLTMRSDANKGAGSFYDVSRSHIIDPLHEIIDFETSDPKYQQALNDTISDWQLSTRRNKRPDSPEIPSGKRIRQQRSPKNALLLIYPLNPKPKGWENSSLDIPVIGYAISFPKNEYDQKLSYRVNDVFKSEYNYEEVLDEITDES